MAFADSGSGRTVRPVAGHVQASVTLAGTVQRGDLIGFSTGYKRADADTGPIKAAFIAMQSGISGESIPVCTEAVVDGFTGGTPGALMYPSGTPGQYSDSQVNSQPSIGQMISATECYVVTDPTAQ